MKNKLLKLLEQNNWNITEEVIKEAMDYHNPKSFLEDVLQYGCVSWMVSSLIRYRDTHEFYDKHYDEIEEIRKELEEQGLEIKLPSHEDLKNFFAWLSFEHRSYELYNNLGLNR